MERDNPWPQFSSIDSYSQLPSQYLPLTPPPSRFTSLPPSGSHASTVGDSGSTHNTHVVSVRASRFSNTEECIHRFREWLSGRGGLSPPKNNEESLVLRVSVQNFGKFKKFLGLDDENESAR